MINSEIGGLRSTLGNNGGIMLTDTTAVTGEFTCAYIIADATFTLLTTPEYTKNGVVTAVEGSDWGTMSAGSIIPARITACTLASGKVLLVK